MQGQFMLAYLSIYNSYPSYDTHGTQLLLASQKILHLECTSSESII